MLNKAFIFGLFAQFLQYGSSLLVLPFVLVNLTESEVGIWYVFVTMMSFSLLIDFGFKPTIARNIALAYSGVRQLKKVGIDRQVTKLPNYPLILKVLNSSKVLYLCLSVIALIIMTSAGTFYISTLLDKNPNLENTQIYAAWLIISLGVSLELYFSWVPSFMIGSDNVGKNYLYIIINKTVFAILAIAFVLGDYGILGLSTAYTFAILLARYIAVFQVRDEIANIKKNSMYGETDSVIDVFKIMLPNAFKIGLVSFSSFLIIRYNLLIASSNYSLAVAASYGISLQVLMAINSTAKLFFTTNLPKIIKYKVKHEVKSLKSVFIRSAFCYLSISCVCSLLVVAYGDTLLQLLGSNSSFLKSEIFILLAMIIILEGNHSNCALVITAGNNIPFVPSALISGFAIVVLSTLLSLSGSDFIFVVLAQGIVQLLYNNWKWPFYIYKEIWSA